MATEDDVITELVSKHTNDQRREVLETLSLRVLRATADLVGASYAESMTRKQAIKAIMADYSKGDSK
jgi:hypothetical protein